MSIGLVVDGTDYFLQPIENALQEGHNVARFTPRFVRLPLIGKRVNDWLLDEQLRRFMRQHDAVFFEWAGSLLIRASHLPRLEKNQIVTRLHSVELATAAEQINWSQVDTLIVLNETLLTKLQNLVREPLPPVAIVANGVDLKRFQPLHQAFRHRIGMVCNLLPIKRVYEVLLVLHQLRVDGYPFTLSIAGKTGKGEAQRYVWAMQNLIRKLDIEDCVRFDGYVKDIASWLQGIDVYISNSYWEGQSMALIEAMASGCHCLSHCWDGVEEMLPQENIFTTDGDLRAKLLACAALYPRQKSGNLRRKCEPLPKKGLMNGEWYSKSLKSLNAQRGDEDA